MNFRRVLGFLLSAVFCVGCSGAGSLGSLPGAGLQQDLSIISINHPASNVRVTTLQYNLSTGPVLETITETTIGNVVTAVATVKGHQATRTFEQIPSQNQTKITYVDFSGRTTTSTVSGLIGASSDEAIRGDVERVITSHQSQIQSTGNPKKPLDTVAECELACVIFAETLVGYFACVGLCSVVMSPN